MAKLFSSKGRGAHEKRSGKAPARVKEPTREEKVLPVEDEPEISVPAREIKPERAAEVKETPEAKRSPAKQDTKKAAGQEERETKSYEVAPAVRLKENKKSLFGLGFAIYAVVLILAVLAGLATLWRFLDSYERSRTYKPMDKFMSDTAPEGWRAKLRELGVGESYLSGLDVTKTEYYKLLGEYTDETPVYGVRVGGEKLLKVSLARSEELAFGFKSWALDKWTLIPSRLAIYAPPDAIVTVAGASIGADSLVKENAQPLELGPLEKDRTDIPGLSKYELNNIYDNADVQVTDGFGRELALSFSSGRSYYYAPLMSSWTVTAPKSAVVTVNGVPLDETNSAVEDIPIEDFTGVEEWLPFVPALRKYTVPDLIARPVVDAVETNGAELLVTEGEDSVSFDWAAAVEVESGLNKYVMDAFDAYVAFSGNRGGNISGNLSRYRKFLLKDAEAYQRADQARGSLIWTSGGRDKKLKNAAIGQFIQYSDKMFGARIDFTLTTDETDGANSYLFVFVAQDGEWKLVRVLNKTSLFGT